MNGIKLLFDDGKIIRPRSLNKKCNRTNGDFTLFTHDNGSIEIGLYANDEHYIYKWLDKTKILLKSLTFENYNLCKKNITLYSDFLHVEKISGAIVISYDPKTRIVTLVFDRIGDNLQPMTLLMEIYFRSRFMNHNKKLVFND